MSTRNGNAAEIVAEASGRGWRVRRGGHGYVAKCPAECRCQVSIAASPGSMRYYHNVLASLRRCTAWH